MCNQITIWALALIAIALVFASERVVALNKQLAAEIERMKKELENIRK